MLPGTFEKNLFLDPFYNEGSQAAIVASGQ